MNQTANDEVRGVLEKILYEYSLGAKSDLHLELNVDEMLKNSSLTKTQFLKVIDNLLERKIVRRHDLWKSNRDTMTIRYRHPLQTDFNMCVLELTVDFSIKAKAYLKELGGNLNAVKNLALYLDQSGNLWHTDKDSFCYKMKKSDDRYKLCRYLFEHNDGSFIPTKDIAEDLVKKDSNIMSEIGKLRTKISNELQLDDVIENEIGSGYRLNPFYKTMIVK